MANLKTGPVRAVRMACCLIVAGMVSACVTPKSMHVTEGISPQKVDTYVRFRTTYYFRVFDYCWAADTDNNGYRKIVPETDTLYRYRMTGKAPSITNKIKFESGVLDASTIAPFGADVVYNSDINGYVVRSQDEARQQAKVMADAREAQTQRNSALARFQTLATMLADAKEPPEQTAAVEKLKDAMKDALQDFTGTLRAPLNTELATRLTALQATVNRIDDKGATAGPPPSTMTEADLEKARKAFAQEVGSQLAALRVDLANTSSAADACSVNQSLKRGFQIMGPEGMRPFDQEKRLVMAMSSSAKPLIETLNEYSSRILKPQVNPAEQLLPLARETTSVVDAQRAVYAEALMITEKDSTKARISTLFDQAMKAFTPEAK